MTSCQELISILKGQDCTWNENSAHDFLMLMMELIHNDLTLRLSDSGYFLDSLLPSYAISLECSKCSNQRSENLDFPRALVHIIDPLQTTLGSIFNEIQKSSECERCNNESTTHFGGYLPKEDLTQFGLNILLINPDNVPFQIPEIIELPVDDKKNRKYQLSSFLVQKKNGSRSDCTTYRRTFSGWYKCENEKVTIVSSISNVIKTDLILFYEPFVDGITSELEKLIQKAFPLTNFHSVLESTWFLGQMYSKLPLNTWFHSSVFDCLNNIWGKIFQNISFVAFSKTFPSALKKLTLELVDIVFLYKNLNNNHWTCLICWMDSPKIVNGVYFDSLGGQIPEVLTHNRNLNFDNCEYKLRISKLRQQPLQPDAYSCGFYVLFFMERVLQMYKFGATRSGKIVENLQTIINDVAATLENQIHFHASDPFLVTRSKVLDSLKREFLKNYTMVGLLEKSFSFSQYFDIFQYPQTNKLIEYEQKKTKLFQCIPFK